MQKNLRILVLILALLLVATLESRGQADPGIRDTLRIDSVASFISGVGVVPVHFYNDEQLYGVEMTVQHNGVGIRIDSFSFAGGRVANVAFRNRRISSDGKILNVSALEGGAQNIPVGNGLLGHIYLSYDETVVQQTAVIDSITWAPDATFTTDFILPSVVAFTPEFVKGYLTVAENPPSFDSIWVANGSGVAGMSVAVDIFLFNERNTRDVSVALTWGSDRLTFDSLSFEGMRADPAQSKFTQYSNALHQCLGQITFGDDVPLAPGTGLFMQAWFSIDESTPDTAITIDSASYAGVQGTFLLLTAVDGNREVRPIFRSGELQVSVATDVDDQDGSLLPRDFALMQNYPNPFNPTTVIEFALPRASNVKIELYDITGRLVRTLTDGSMSAGTHKVSFDGRSSSGNQLASGVYFYRLQANDFTATKKMLLMK
ncbi:MAG: T9SS type A sorting domain-containing protein [bacterium]|nr:T9SS type A sorting domain-containing protein [bacterium]